MKRHLPKLLFLVFFMAQNLVFAVSFTDSLQTILNSNSPDSIKANACLELTRYYRGIDFEKSILFATRGVKLSEEMKQDQRRVEFEKELGLTYFQNGNQAQGIQSFLKGVKIFEEKGERNLAGDVIIELATLLRKNREPELAQGYLMEAMHHYSEGNHKEGIANTFNQLGIVYEAKDLPDSALYWFNKGKALYETLHDELGVSYSLTYIAGVHMLRREYDQALQSLNQALALRIRLNHKEALCQVYTALGECYESKGEFAVAVTYFKQSIDLAKENGIPDILQYNYEQVANIFQQTGNYKEALEYYSLYQSLKDSIYNNTRSRQLDEMRSKFETDKREQKLALAKNENALKDLELRRKNFLLLLGLGLVIVTILLSLLLYNRYKWKKESEIAATRMQHQEQTAKAVIETEERERRRIAGDLHDGIGQMLSAAKMNMSALSNDLNIKGADQQHFFDRTQDIIDECCREVRTISHQMMPNVLLKNGLASAVREFVNKVDSPVLKVNLHTHGIQERIDGTLETVLYRVIQECVNNVIKHSQANLLEIQILKDSEEISVTIEDNGKGFDLNKVGESDGIGLKNIRTRVEYLNGKVHFDSNPGRGTLIHVEIPLNS